MIRTEKRLRLCTALLVLNLALIWGNSLLPGEISGQISRGLGAILEKLFDLPVGGDGTGHGLLRKLGHFSEFACLGMLFCWRAGMAGETGRHLWMVPLLGCMMAACADETIQVFVPDRGPSVIDVWIDTCGAAAGMGLLRTGHHFIRKKKQNN